MLDERAAVRAAGRGGRASTRRASGRRAASRAPTVAAGPRRSSRPCRRASIATTRWSCWSENHRRSVVPARPFGKRETVEHDVVGAAASRVGTVLLAAARVGLTSSSACAPDSGSSGTTKTAASSAPMPRERDRPAEPAERIARAARDEEPESPIRARRRRAAARSTWRAPRWGRARRRACPSAMPPAPAMRIETRRHHPEHRAAGEEEDHLRGGRDARARSPRPAGGRALRPAGRRARARPARECPVVTVRNSAMPVFEKPCTSVRYLFVSCDDGALNTLVRKATPPSRTNRRP